jgi:DUF2933 family protein
MNQQHAFPDPAPRRLAGPSRSYWALAAFLIIAGFFLFTEHRAHAFAILPYLLLLACPLLHFFHHHGHSGGHAGHHGHGGGQADTDEEVAP